MIRNSMMFTACILAFSLSSVFAADTITNIQMSPESPDIMTAGTHVDITFDYETDEAGGVLIWVRPFTQGALSPGYHASGSDTHPVGTGSGAGWFTIDINYTTVDSVRVQMWDDGNTTMLFEQFIPVKYYFGPPPVDNIVMIPASPAGLLFGDQVDITFDYQTNRSGGVRIYPRPMITGGPNGGWGASGSPLYPVGIGDGSGFFTVRPPQNGLEEALQAATVNEIRFQMKTEDQSYIIAEFFVPVSYTFDSTVPTRETTWGRIKAIYSTQ